MTWLLTASAFCLIVRLALAVCSGTEVVVGSSGQFCCDATTQWCRTSKSLASLQNFTLDSNYSLLIDIGHTLLTTSFTITGSLRLANNSFLFVNTKPLMVFGDAIEIDGSAELNLVNGGFIQVLDNRTCISISNEASLVFEFNSSYLAQSNYTVPVFQSNDTLCIIGNGSFGSMTTIDTASASGLPPPSWSTNNDCISGSSLVVAFTISCPSSPPPPPPPINPTIPTYKPIEYYNINITYETPSSNISNGTNSTSPSLSLNNSQVPSENSIAIVPTSELVLKLDTAIIIVIIVIGILLLVAIAIALLFRYNEALRKKAMPHHDRTYFSGHATSNSSNSTLATEKERPGIPTGTIYNYGGPHASPHNLVPVERQERFIQITGSSMVSTQ